MNDITVQDIFQQFYQDYLEQISPSVRQAKTATHILNCKTGAYGSTISLCEECGVLHYHHNSCRDRNCPMCMEFPRARWVEAQKENVLDAPYFHVVFTLPHELNPLIYSNQKLLYNLLYHCSAQSILELCVDPKYLGAKVGFFSILHTWSSDMQLHPHLHMIVLGGGLDTQRKWKSKGDSFFLPIKVISRVFRGKYLEGLEELFEAGKLLFPNISATQKESTEFQKLLDICYSKEWVPHCKETLPKALNVIEYLGRYTHRIAISNHRILSMDQDTVTYRVKDYRKGGEWFAIKVSGIEFIRRFLLHVLPKGFVRIRYYGILSSRNRKENLITCRNQIGGEAYISVMKDMTVEEMLYHLYGIDVRVCPSCGSQNYKKLETVSRVGNGRGG